MSKKDVYLKKIYALFEEYGVEGLTMEDIADRIGVSKMTLYNNFKDKETLIREILSYRQKGYIAYMEKLKGKKYNAIQMIIHVLQFQATNPLPSFGIFYRTFRKVYPKLYEMQQKHSRDVMISFIRDNMKQGIEEGIYRNDFNPGAIIVYITAIMGTVLNNKTDKALEIDLNRTHMEFINYHIRGIANEKGVKILEKEFLNYKKAGDNDKL